MSSPPKIAAVVLAAGRGVRFRSAHSKLVHSLTGRPVIQWPLAALRKLGIDPIVVVVGHDAESVKAACGDGVVFAVQAERRGTGHAVMMAAPLLANFDGCVLILNGDVPLIRAATLERLIAEQRRSGAPLVLGTGMVSDPSGWGRIVRHDGALTRIVEEKDATPQERSICEVNVGLYCVIRGVLLPLLDQLTPDNAQGELYLTDLVALAARHGIKAHTVEIDMGEVAQINSRAELAAMERSVRKGINNGWMDAGVTLEDPDTTYIEPEVFIGCDTVIGPNVQLRGRTRIGEGCRLDGTDVLSDAVLGDGVHVKFAVVMTQCEVGAGCVIGPLAQLRPGAQLMEGVHIGDFVETKNAVIGPRTKANHLAYLGDVEIGADTNIGAGTITCNYDGFRKHRTIIGDRVQVGSDSQLVAPVSLADDVYVATGTTVREDVPAGALVFNPKGEEHRPGWVARRRALSAEVTPAPAKERKVRQAAARGKRGRAKGT